ncbi:MAG: hypothetical protein K6T51_06375 [Rubrobacteraceae bacterium]|nr:hypothetical protein [Rubrobacteraceae bacterium]
MRQDTAESPWLLILTRADDREADRVGLRLAARGFSYRRIDVDASSPTGLTLSISSGTIESRLHFEQTAKLRSPAVIWLRHFDVFAVRPPVKDPVVVAFARSEWEHAVRSLLSLERTKWINRPDAILNLGRVSQICLAHRVGLAVPRTLVSNDRRDIREFIASSPSGVVVKVLGDHFVEPEPGKLYGVFPRLVTEADMVSLERAYLTPSIYQEYVPHVREVRATVIGEDVVAVEISKASPEDIWERPEEVAVHPHDLPARVLGSLLRFLRLARLEYGAFDLLLTEDGYTFLEVNPTGDWAWLESKDGSIRVTEKVVSHIAGLLEESERCG